MSKHPSSTGCPRLLLGSSPQASWLQGGRHQGTGRPGAGASCGLKGWCPPPPRKALTRGIGGGGAVAHPVAGGFPSLLPTDRNVPFCSSGHLLLNSPWPKGPSSSLAAPKLPFWSPTGLGEAWQDLGEGTVGVTQGSGEALPETGLLRLPIPSVGVRSPVDPYEP